MLVSANIFQPLIDVFQSVLVFFHGHLGVSWGFSIVLLTICVRALLIPLTVKQFGSMQRLQQLQPELKALQAKYKDDKERQQQEMMRFYKENKVNPLGSCLPLAAQIPVFISLFYMLRQSLRADICPQLQPRLASGMIDHAHLRPCGVGHGAGFLFVGDLTNKATGLTLIVLIVLYIGSQLASSLMMSSATMDPTQRKIMLFMPLIFVLFVINFPAGVLVYWITTNTWTMAQQFVIRRRIGPVKSATAGAATATSVVPAEKPASRRGADGNGAAPDKANGTGSGGSLGSRLLARAGQQRQEKPAEEAKVATPQARASRPPQPPRKKKKRSGRRR
ncbi:MAG TPA: YidC/Oxa1 family membrane protein insertase [Solirubrobacteraceae bacterium]|jgi:YidC/Oxa1 family membrane protein insertase